MSIAAPFTTAKIWNHHKYPSTDVCIRKIWYTYAVEYYSTIKRIKFCLFQQYGWTCNIRSEMSYKDKYHML